MKKALAVLLSVVMIIGLLSGCSEKSSDDSYYGDVPTKNSLRICIDPGTDVESYAFDEMLDALHREIKEACEIESLTIEVLPGEGAERKTAQMRLRTEIMAGGGPDVFIMKTVSVPSITGVDINAQFNFPEKNMEAGLFLPLDEYMEDYTQFTDWNAQTKAVLDAGRTDEGQVVIPTTYTFSVLVYPESENTIPYTSNLRMQDILENPETAEIGKLLYSGVQKVDEYPIDITWIDSRQLPFLLGELADYRTDELLFARDELQTVLTDMLNCFDAVKSEQEQYMQRRFIKNHVSYSNLIYEVFNAYFDEEMSLVPMYSTEGGVTASVRSFAAVNRNTRFPEKAFSVIDYIMQEKKQCESVLYSSFFVDGIPLQNDLGSEEKALQADSETLRYLEEPIFEDLLRIKEQITAVNFQNELDAVLDELVMSASTDAAFADDLVAKSYVSHACNKMERMMGE